MNPEDPGTDHGRVAREVLAAAGGDLRRSWRALAVADLGYKLIAFALLGPLLAFVARLAVTSSGGPAVADLDILFFLLRPVGLVAVVVVAAIAVAITALEQACLMTLMLAHDRGQSLRFTGAFAQVLRQARRVLRFALLLVARSVPLAAPFLAGIALVYVTLLREFDINYYLAQRPPAFIVAVALAVLLAIGLGWVLGSRLLGWSLGLPMLLFGGLTPRAAFPESRRRTDGHRWSVALLLVAWALSSLLASALALALPGVLVRGAVAVARDAPGILLVMLGAILALWAILNLAAGVASAVVFAALVLRLYLRIGGADAAGVAAHLPASVTVDAAAGRRLTRRRLAVGLTVAGIAAAIVTVALGRQLRMDRQVLVVAHRGAAGSAPENTLASVRRAVEDGADWVEIDVQETAEGEVVVLHDSDLMRVGGNPLEIWDATRADLEAIDIGSWFGSEFAGERVPTLLEVLEACRGRAGVNIELKYYGHDQRLEQRVIDLVEQAGVADRVVLMSLEIEGIRKAKALRPQWTAGLLTAKAAGDLTRLDADFLAVASGLVTRRFVRTAHERGKQVLAWTVNDPVTMLVMTSRGVDGLITDHPALAREVLARRNAMSPLERLLVGLALFLGYEPQDAAAIQRDAP